MARRRAVSAATILGLVTTVGLVVSPAQVSAASITNLGISTWESRWTALDGGGAAFIVRESDEGGSDLNGDGDAFDFVLHRWGPDTGITNLGISVGTSEGPVALDGGGIAALRRSPFSVIVVDDVGSITDLGIAGAYWGGLTALDGGGLAVPVSESPSYGGTGDLNGDGDQIDFVMQVWDPTTGITNLGVAVSDFPRALDGGGVAFVASEVSQGGTDLNGDGYSAGESMHVWDPVAGVTNLGIYPRSDYLTSLGGGGIAFAARESGESSSDLNGDGDTSDTVVHVWEPARGLSNLGLAAGSDRPVGLDGGGLAFTVSEALQGLTDLNGDGFSGSNVVHVWDSAGGTTNLGIASKTSSFSIGLLVALDGDGLALSVPESGVDLNGDGDTNDFVVHTWDSASGFSSLGFAGSPGVALEGGGLASNVSEAAEGGTDLNGDGDTNDFVLHVWDPATGVINLRLAGGGRGLVGGGLAFSVSESAQGATDLNGDGDTTDLVGHVWDPAGSSPEVCDGIDNDYDGTVDEGVTTVFYADGDGDGYGDADVTAAACSAPVGFVTDSDDADDNDDTVYPGAPELDDGKDNDQDGTIDEGLDGDGDGFTPVAGGDADDNDPTIYPGAAELCDGKDNDQDGTTDEGWPDADGDTVADCVDAVTSVAFVAGTATGAVRDQPVISRLRSMGLQVTVIDDNVVSAASVAGFDLIVLSSSVVPTTVGTKLTEVAVPIVTWEGYLFDELKLTTTGSETPTAQSRVSVVSPGHPVAAGLTGTVTILSTAKQFNQASAVAAGVTVVATTVAGRGTILAADTGDVLTSGVAAARRVTLPWNYEGPGFTNDNGWALFEAAVQWALADGAPPAPASITIANTTVVEGDAGTTNAVLAVSASAARASDITLSFTTAGATATAGDDYTATTGTVTILANTITAQITIPVAGDTDDEGDETFTVELTGVTGPGVIGSASVATVTIDDDDAITTTPSSVAFVAGLPTGAAKDRRVIDHLNSMGFAATIIDDDVVTSASVAAFDLVVVSSSVVPTKLGSKLTDVAVPVITWEAYIVDDLKLAATATESATTQTRVTIVESTHPIAAGLTGTVAILSTATKQNHLAGVAPGVTIVANSQTGQPSILAADTGAALTSGLAPARRVSLSWSYDSPPVSNTNGYTIFDAAVQWALN